MTLAVVNHHPTQALPARLQIVGGDFRFIGGHELTAASMLASNSLAPPTEEVVQRCQIPASAGSHAREFPARSITLLLFESRR